MKYEIIVVGGGHAGIEASHIAAFVFSLYKALPDVITPELINKMVDAVFRHEGVEPHALYVC